MCCANHGTFEPDHLTVCIFYLLIPQDNIPAEGCSADADCSSSQDCASSVCYSGRCSTVLSMECCGNYLCEEGEDTLDEETSLPVCSDCGLITLDTPTCKNCSTPMGIMFDVTTTQDIIVKNLRVQLSGGKNYLVVYISMYGNYSEIATDPSQWAQVYTDSFEELGKPRSYAVTAFTRCSLPPLLILGI